MPLFMPTNQFNIAKEGENYTNLGKMSKTLQMVISPIFEIGGVPMYVYRFNGTFDQEKDAVGVKKDEHGSKHQATDIGSFMGIEDPILMENRDRRYNFDEVPMLRGIYTVSSSELELLRFGFSTNEVLSVEFATHQVEQMLGRRFIIGDVIELPHTRQIGVDGRAANRWYEVKSVTNSPSGIDPAYQSHVLGVIIQPIRDQQEFLDIMENVTDPETGETLQEATSNLDQAMSITKAVQDKAIEHSPSTKFNTTYLYYDPNDLNRKPQLFFDDAIPPNGLKPIGSGMTFPADASEGDWFVRTDHVPNRMYQLHNQRWILREVDRKKEWHPYSHTTKAREFVSDGSVKDSERPWKLRTLHDTLTEREALSDPSNPRNVDNP